MLEFLQGYLRFNVLGLMCVATGTLCLTLGLFVAINEKNSKINKAFFLFTLFAANWLLCFGLLNLAEKTDQFLLWLRLSYLTIPFIPVTTYIFGLRLRGIEPFNRLTKLGIGLGLIFSVVMISKAEQLAGIKDYSWGRYPYFFPRIIPFSFFGALMSHYILYISYSFHNFFRFWRDGKNKKDRKRGAYLFFGFFAVYTAWSDFAPTIGIPLYPFGNISVAIFVVVIFYTIVRHQLLDIKILLKRITLIFAIYSILLIATIPTSIFIGKNLLNQPGASPINILIGLGVVMGLVLSAGPAVYAYFVRRSYWLRGHVTTGLTHELKSPLAIIESVVALAQDNVHNPTKTSEYLTLIQNNTIRLQNFVKDLLTVAKTTDDEITLEKEPFDFSDLIRSVVEIQTPAATQKNILLKVEAQPTEILADSAKVRQVLSNLLSNAIKFSSEGTINITLEKKDGDILCTVQDDGVGIEKIHLAKVFDRFFQARPGTKGSGIGLTIAKTWVEAHGGKIWAESEGEGKGTTMRFTLPVT